MDKLCIKAPIRLSAPFPKRERAKEKTLLRYENLVILTAVEDFLSLAKLQGGGTKYC
ncbi:hypothetical protein G6M26_24380 [Agrobacterium tumefaciens]|nr:hypothetical protein [Agrobacterium tumefaciens]NTE21683.1 hypothetical protein [Agrobacterium tumefaciens]